MTSEELRRKLELLGPAYDKREQRDELEDALELVLELRSRKERDAAAAGKQRELGVLWPLVPLHAAEEPSGRRKLGALGHCTLPSKRVRVELSALSEPWL